MVIFCTILAGGVSHRVLAMSSTEPSLGEKSKSRPSKSNGVANDNGDQVDATYKVLLMGDAGVGKTCLIRALTGKPFSHNMVTTVGE